ncbi:hypothetical protein FJU11_02580 [Pararhizobium mangrovi]|uniref:Integral membrane bound transporter domain-containing protein n=1 Tax=Pararhizobium mangrovi TaxID=2590452 RepID=A0A506UBT3_9HYPH|nr:hypothetical protein FJU11_02580 [Pararhizobium mangrovi]
MTPPIAPRRRVLARLRDRIVASDPAFSRLRLASRAVLSMTLIGLLLTAITFVHPLPIAAYGIATIIGFLGSLAIRDVTVRDQIVSRALAGLAGCASIFVAGLLAAYPFTADIVFLVVIFAAVAIRRFGPRGFAAGMIAFIAFFMGDYLHPAANQIGWIALAAFLGLAITQIVSSVILVDDPERDFRRATTTIDRRINLVLRELRRASRAGTVDRTNRRYLQGHLARLHAIMLMAEGFIPQEDGGALAGHGPASELAVALFDLQLSVERLVAASMRALPPEDLLVAALYRDSPGLAKTAEGLRGAPEGNRVATCQVLLRTAHARDHLAAKLAEDPLPAFAKRTDRPGTTSAGGNGTPAGGSGENGKTPWIPERWHLPIQVTLASALAMAGGVLISSTRWYWAVIAAFIVFNNTRSRADTAVRALERSAGTLAGVIAGTIIATLLHGSIAVSIGGIMACFFFGFYFLQTSYGVMIFFITIALALLYGLMGLFTPELLVLRLEETVLGALSGVFCAFLVFPKRATAGVTVALEGYLTTLGEALDAIHARAHGKDAGADILAPSRTLDRKLADLATAARPLGGPWNVVTRYGQVREKLLVLTGCTHWVRALARGISHGRTLSADELAEFDRLVVDVRERISAARERKDRFFLKPPRSKPAVPARTPRRELAINEDESPIQALEIIAALLERAMSGPKRANFPTEEPAPHSSLARPAEGS